ncbi:MAG TPA: hypothetical protein VJ276_25815 [Thermoanaerobaculia bacterium]|nr:hypothetical protein [Thermoanaerobaculia bacterium]
MALEKLSLSRFHNLPSTELDMVVEHAIAEVDPDDKDAFVALFRNRALRLIRNGSSSDLREEAMSLNRRLYVRGGRELLQRDPAYHARLQTIADMLGEASQRTDSVFLTAVLSSYSKYARPLIELLSRFGSEGVPRQKILTDLKIPSEAYLSRMLRALEEADVVVRHRREGVKGIRVALGHAGREMVSKTLAPNWFLLLMKMLNDAVSESSSLSPTKVAAALEKADVPSSLFADHVVDLMDKIAKRKPRAEARDAAAAPSGY